MLDLRSIALPDLQALTAVFSAMGQQGNRFFEDQFVILSRVALQSHELLEMNEYTDDDLLKAIEFLKLAIDGVHNLPEEHPGKMFLKYSLTAAHNELQKRARKQNLRAVMN